MHINTITELLALPKFQIVSVLEHTENSLHLSSTLWTLSIPSVPLAAFHTMSPSTALVGDALKT